MGAARMGFDVSQGLAVHFGCLPYPPFVRIDAERAEKVGHDWRLEGHGARSLALTVLLADNAEGLALALRELDDGAGEICHRKNTQARTLRKANMLTSTIASGHVI
jgi:hypothetical protein